VGERETVEAQRRRQAQQRGPAAGDLGAHGVAVGEPAQRPPERSQAPRRVAPLLERPGSERRGGAREPLAGQRGEIGARIPEFGDADDAARREPQRAAREVPDAGERASRALELADAHGAQIATDGRDALAEEVVLGHRRAAGGNGAREEQREGAQARHAAIIGASGAVLKAGHSLRSVTSGSSRAARHAGMPATRRPSTSAATATWVIHPGSRS